MNRGRPKKMKDRVQITLSLSQGVLDLVDWYGRKSGISRAEVIRIAINVFLGGSDDGKEKC